MSIVLQLSLCVVSVIHLTSSQPACDVSPHASDDQVLRLLVTVNSQLAKTVSQLQSDVAGMKADIGYIKRDIARVKAVVSYQRPDCPASFTYIKSVNGCYKVVNRNLNWAAAGRACRSLHKDAHLVVINDAQEQLEVAGLLASARLQAAVARCYPGPFGKYFWTAGQRRNPSTGSTLVWRVKSDTSSDIVSTMSYTNWSPGQPDYARQEESCVHLWSGISYTWNDIRCNLATCSVCEIDI